MKLYRYLNDHTFRDHIESHLRGEIFLSSWREFNDPMEGYFQYVSNRDHNQMIDRVVGEKSGYRVCCFCKSYKKYLLWSYYTNKHRGVCLEYTIDPAMLTGQQRLIPVTYSATLPCFDPTVPAEEQAIRFLTTKIDEWRQEQEVRLLVQHSHSHTMVFGRLTGIVFGVNYSDGDQADTYRQQAANHVYALSAPGPRLYQAYIDGDRPQINRRRFDRFKQNKIEVI